MSFRPSEPDDGPGYPGRRVLVLGASGFIGRRVARRLADRGVRPTLVARDAADIDTLDPSRHDAVVVEADLLEPAAVEDLVADVQPDITFNLVAYGVLSYGADWSQREEELAFEVNSELVERLCTAISTAGGRERDARGVQLVHVGTAAEYGQASGNLHEGTIPRPTTPYGRSKLAGTQAVLRARRELGVRGLTARVFSVYGPGEPPSRLLPSLMRIAETGESLELTAGTQKRDFIYLGDVVEALLRLGELDGPQHGIYNVATGKLTSVRRFVTIASGVLGIRPSQLEFEALPVRAQEMSHSDVDVRRLTGALGWRPTVTIEEGIMRTRDLSTVARE